MIALVFDQDVDATNSLKYPHLYGAGHKNVYFNFKVFWIWVALAAWHGSLCYWVTVGAFGYESPNPDGIDSGLWWVSTLAFTLVIHLVTFKLFIEISSWSLLVM